MSARGTPLLAAGVLALLALGGCATLDNGTDDSVPVVTDPPGASVLSASGATCISPCRVVGPRKDSFVVTIAKPGFVSQTIVSESTPTAGLAEATRLEPSADFLGRIIDAQDGSHNEHVPAAIVVKLEPVK